MGTDPFNPEVLTDDSPFDDFQPQPPNTEQKPPADPPGVGGNGEKKEEKKPEDETLEDKLKAAEAEYAKAREEAPPDPDEIMLQKLEELSKKVDTVKQEAGKVVDPKAEPAKEPETWEAAYDEAAKRALIALEQKEAEKKQQEEQIKLTAAEADKKATKDLADQLGKLKEKGLLATKADELELLNVAYELGIPNVINAYKVYAERRELRELRESNEGKKDIQDRKNILGRSSKGGSPAPAGKPAIKTAKDLRAMSLDDVAQLAKRV